MAQFTRNQRNWLEPMRKANQIEAMVYRLPKVQQDEARRVVYLREVCIGESKRANLSIEAPYGKPT